MSARLSAGTIEMSKLIFMHRWRIILPRICASELEAMDTEMIFEITLPLSAGYVLGVVILTISPHSLTTSGTAQGLRNGIRASNTIRCVLRMAGVCLKLSLCGTPRFGESQFAQW